MSRYKGFYPRKQDYISSAGAGRINYMMNHINSYDKISWIIVAARKRSFILDLFVTFVRIRFIQKLKKVEKY